MAYLLAYGKTFKNTACACYSSAAINRINTVYIYRPLTDQRYTIQLYNATGRTWEAAQADCRGLGDGWDLPIPETLDILTEIAKVLDPPASEYFLGAERGGIGLPWSWTAGGVDWSNDNWAPGEPKAIAEDCCGVVGGSLGPVGEWFAVSKDETLQTVVTVCQKGKESTQAMTAGQTITF